MSRRPPPYERNTNPTLGTLVRQQTEKPWTAVKRLISSGKVFVDNSVCVDPGFRPHNNQTISIRQNAKTPKRRLFEVRIVHQDAHVVVIDKPSGVSSVPYSADERDTAIDLLRCAWRQRGEQTTGPVFVVHRIDKDTSGLLMFARSKGAEIKLGRQFREHTIGRQYSCVVNGKIHSQQLKSYLLRDRGDGLRGSNRYDQRGKYSITHVTAEQELPGATQCSVRLETGRTHQIRIHLSEAGHPLVGERVYSRDFFLAERPLIPCPRLLLHAQTLQFVHPVYNQTMHFQSEYPANFRQALAAIERGTHR